MSDNVLKSKAEKIRKIVDVGIEVEARTDYSPSCLLVRFPHEHSYSPMIIPPNQVNRFMMLVGA